MKINFLDHVAIRVKDPAASAQWYEETLGLTRLETEEYWGPQPIFVVAGKSGIALFPEKVAGELNEVTSRMHIAFNVDKQSFRSIQHTFEQKGIEFSFEDHHWFHSIYINDPDGYVVELTTEVIETPA